MADGSDYQGATTQTKPGRAKPVPAGSGFGFASPLAMAALVVLIIFMALGYSNRIGYQLEKPAWACEWALLILANIGLSLFVLFVGDRVDNKKPEDAISAKSLFIISLGVVITVGLYCCMEFFVIAKPTFLAMAEKGWVNSALSFRFQGNAEQTHEQNNVIRLLAMWSYNHLHEYGQACASVPKVNLSGDVNAAQTYGCIEEAHFHDFRRWYLTGLALVFAMTVTCAAFMAVMAAQEARSGKKSLALIGEPDANADADLIARIRKQLADKQAELEQLRRDRDAHAGARETAEKQVAALRAELARLETDLNCVEMAAAEMARIKAQADGLEQKLAACLSQVTAATAAVFQDVMKVFVKARTDMGGAPKGLSDYAATLRARIADIRGKIAGGVPAAGVDMSARIARLEGEIETLSNWLKACEAQPRGTVRSVALDEHGQVVIPGLLAGGRYELREASEPKTHTWLMAGFAILLLTINNFAIAPEISHTINPEPLYGWANLGLAIVLGVLGVFAMSLFRRRDAEARTPWLSWLIAAAAVLLSAILAYMLTHLPSPPPPPAVPLKPMTVNCDMGRNIGEADGPHTAIAWTFGSASQIDLIQASPSQCHIQLTGDPSPKYAIAVGIASQEGAPEQFDLAYRRADTLARVFLADHKTAPVYLLIVGQHAHDNQDLAPSVYTDPHIATRDQRQAVVLGGNVDATARDATKLFGAAQTQLGLSLPMGEYTMRCFYRQKAGAKPQTFTWERVAGTADCPADPAAVPVTAPVQAVQR